MNLDFKKTSEIKTDIETIEHLIALKPFENITDLYIQKAILTKIMIDLTDLTTKADKDFNSRITFTDDVMIDLSSNIADVSDLIRIIRNALCHIDSNRHKFDKSQNITLSYNILYGKCPNAFDINGTIIGSDYDDDICIIFGSQKIYYNRHIIRTFEECKKIFKTI